MPPPATDSTAFIGRAIPRREDWGLLTGATQYTDDLDVRGAVHLAVKRSDVAHATIRDVAVDRAERTSGVLAVYTAADIQASPYRGEVPLRTALHDPGEGGPPVQVRHGLSTVRQPFLAREKTRYVGEPVAVVVADDRYTAHTAADRVRIEYDRHDAVTDPSRALDPDAPSLHDERPGNVAFEWAAGDADAVDRAFDRAAHTVSVEVDRQRVISNPMEPRACIASSAPAGAELTLWLPGQGPHSQQATIAEAFELAPGNVHIRTPAVGGSFGTKSRCHPEDLLTAWAALELGRPVRWQATRTESHLGSAHGRGHAAKATLALGETGRILGLRVRSHADVGAYVFGSAPLIHTKSLVSALTGQYRIPAASCHVTGTFTNTTPITAFRGTSRPMAILLIERLVAKAAAHLDVDPVTIRRRNFLRPDDFPHRTPFGFTYDTGAYERSLDRALEVVGYEDWRAKQRDGAGDGLLGIGLSCSVDQIGGTTDSARIRVHPSGHVTAYCGTFDTGQGHQTTFSQFLADEFGIPLADIDVIEGDTDHLATGGGTGGSRSAISALETLTVAAGHVHEKARRIAASHLEADPADLEYRDGAYAIAGAPDRSIGFTEVAALAYDPAALPADVSPGLEATAVERAPDTYSFATHVAVVEIDPGSGELGLHEYVAVEDCGPLLNPQIVRGQVHGAVVQGIGQCLSEEVVYDDAGTLLTASFQDYAIPKAAHVPDLTVAFTETPAADTVRGVKGIGESGCNATPAAITNAVYDAIGPATGSPLSPPFTSEKLWRFLNRSSTE